MIWVTALRCPGSCPHHVAETAVRSFPLDGRSVWPSLAMDQRLYLLMPYGAAARLCRVVLQSADGAYGPDCNDRLRWPPYQLRNLPPGGTG